MTVKTLDRYKKLRDKAAREAKVSVRGEVSPAKPCLLAGLLHDPKIGKNIERTEKRYKSGVSGTKRFKRFDRLMSKMSAYNSFKNLVHGKVGQDITSPQKLEMLARSGQTMNRLHSSIER
ncbi:MAG: hypothetical protein J5895_04935 [Alphaproteobacteria bacterium]|nr:hypothetical protein [Alphaproteobacteria bacterium]